MLNFLKSRLKPFSYPSFRIFFFSQFISSVGTWSHELARSWLVLEIAGSAAALGTLLLFSALPGLIFTFHGGSVADRYEVKKVLIVTKSLLSISALTLFFLVEHTHIELWMIYAFGALEGLLNSYDGPSFTSLFSRTLPRGDFKQALAIQSTGFHVSRMLGPAIAGLLMAMNDGPGIVFLFDGITYIFVIFMLLRVELRDKVFETKNVRGEGAIELIKSFRYFFDDPNKRYKQFQLFTNVMIILPLLHLVFRSFLKNKFSLSAEQFGYLFSLPAFGAMAGALYITFANLHKPIRNLRFSIPAMIVFLLAVRHATTPMMAALLLGLCGFFTYLTMASVTQSIHLETPDDYRGRLSSIITLCFGSLGPLMSFPVGYYTDYFGYDQTIRDITILFTLLSATWAYSNFRKRPKDVIDLP